MSSMIDIPLERAPQEWSRGPPDPHKPPVVLEPLVLLALAGVGMPRASSMPSPGGGGLIGIPALLCAGLPPVAALATNKVQWAIGTSIAAFTFWRKGYVVERPMGHTLRKPRPSGCSP